jgi:hypothetical protein
MNLTNNLAASNQYYLSTHQLFSYMLGLYYSIWVDFIIRARSQPANKADWPQKTILIMSVCMAFNFVLIMYVLQQYIIGKFFYTLNLNPLPRQLDYFLNFAILFFLPCLAINYFLIFARKRYEVLLRKYRYRKGRLFIVYASVSIWLPIILVWMMFFSQ